MHSVVGSPIILQIETVLLIITSCGDNTASEKPYLTNFPGTARV